MFFTPCRRPTSCVQGCSERVYAAIKRHTAKIRYNLLPPPFTSWSRQPQQLRQQRQTPRRLIQSSGASTRNASTVSSAHFARRAVAPAYASTASSAPFARRAVAPAYASTASSAPVARHAAAPADASTASSAPIARHAAAPAYARTASTASIARNAKTYRAPWKAARSSATVSAQPESC